MSRRTSDKAAYLRNFVFGVEDSIVSTVGLLSGVAIAGMAREDIFVTGLILIFVEAISMCAGSFLSESSVEELESHTERVSKRSYTSAVVMFVSYFVSGFIPLAPYIFIGGTSAFAISIAVSVVTLLVLGAISARLTRTSLIKSAFRMAFIGGLAITVGIVVGGLAR